MQTAPTHKPWCGPLGPSRWTTEIEDTTRTNWASGVSAAAISVILFKIHGVKFTRQAVIGKANRQGWKTPNSQGGAGGSHVAGAPSSGRTKRANRDQSLAMRFHMPPSFPVERYDTQPVEIKESLNMELLDIPERGCRYSTGENEYRLLFCGHERHGSLPYCAAHARLSYRPARQAVVLPYEKTYSEHAESSA